MKGRKVKTRSARFVVFLVLIMFVVGSFSGGAYALYNTQLFAETVVDEDGNTIPTNPTNPTMKNDINDATASLVDRDDESVNFLFVGVDESELMTDVIMVINLDMKTKRITVLQIPRDCYVGEENSGNGTGKINGVYSHPEKGKTKIATLASFINKKFSVSIDHYATIDIDGFKKVVDILGGVTMDVPQDVIYDGRVAIYAGEQTLNGEQAEWFIRYRKGYADADIGRQKAQVIFLQALLDKMFEVSTKQAASIASQCISMVTTDMTVSDMLGYYNDVLSLGKNVVEFTRVPGEGINNWGPTRQSVYGVDTIELAEILNEYFRPNSEAVPADKLGFMDYRDMEAKISTSTYAGENSSGDEEDDNSDGENSSGNTPSDSYYESASSSSSKSSSGNTSSGGGALTGEYASRETSSVYSNTSSRMRY